MAKNGASDIGPGVLRCSDGRAVCIDERHHLFQEPINHHIILLLALHWETLGVLCEVAGGIIEVVGSRLQDRDQLFGPGLGSRHF